MHMHDVYERGVSHKKVPLYFGPYTLSMFLDMDMYTSLYQWKELSAEELQNVQLYLNLYNT